MITAMITLIYCLLLPIVYLYEKRKQLKENYKKEKLNNSIYQVKYNDIQLTTEQKQVNFIFSVFFPVFYSFKFLLFTLALIIVFFNKLRA